MNPYQVAERTADEREQLILDHLPQVRLIARRIHERLPESVCLDDLVSTGIVGLIAAIDRFDSNHNVKLKTYAEYKIRGAILDSLRGLDWAPRQQRKRTKLIEAAIALLEQRLQRTPTEEEISVELGIAMEEYYEWLAETRGLRSAAWRPADPKRTVGIFYATWRTPKTSLRHSWLRSPSWRNFWPRRSNGCRT